MGCDKFGIPGTRNFVKKIVFISLPKNAEAYLSFILVIYFKTFIIIIIALKYVLKEINQVCAEGKGGDLTIIFYPLESVAVDKTVRYSFI